MLLKRRFSKGGRQTDIRDNYDILGEEIINSVLLSSDAPVMLLIA
jgi:hypothetical protein